MDYIVLFFGAAIMILTGFKFNFEAYVAVGLGLFWIGIALIA